MTLTKTLTKIKTLKIAALLAVLMSMLTLTACGDSTELKNTEFVNAIAVDFTDGQVEVTVELLLSDKALQNQYAESYYYLTGSGENMAQALSALSAQGAKTLSFTHTELAVISAAACTDANLWLDYFLNSYKIRPTIYLAVAENSAAEILENSQTLANSKLILNMLSLAGSQNQGFAGSTLQDFVNAKSSDGAQAVLPIISQTDNVEIQSFAIFDGETYVGKLENSEVIPWLLMAQNENLQGVTLNVGDAVLEVKSSKTNIDINEVPAKSTDEYYLTLDVNTEVEALIRENPSNISDEVLCQMLAEKLELDLIQGIANCQKLTIDYLALGQEIAQHEPKIWQEIQNTDYLNLLHPEITIKTKVGQGVYEN